MGQGINRRVFAKAGAAATLGLAAMETAAAESPQPGTAAAAPGKPSPLDVRPYQLMCMSCFYGARTDELAPIQEDNLFEAIDAIQQNPDIPVTLIRGTCMICPPCSRCDFSAEELLSEHGPSGVGFDPEFAMDVIDRASAAVKEALAAAKPVTHVGLGRGVVEKVASNRRILGPDGKVMHTRWTATKNPEIRAFPAGKIDPELKLIALLHGDEPIVALTYYATHPQSYYRTGLANPDFPGLARNARQEETGVPHVHFNGAGGDVGAGKWNDGSPENRQVLADRVAAGMKRAWESMERSPLAADGVGWTVEPVVLPPSEHMDEAALRKAVEDPEAKPKDRWYAAKNLVWLRRCQSGDPIDVACLRLNAARVLHMPGELLIEYQLAADAPRPVRGHGRLRRLRPRLHPAKNRLQPGRLRGEPGGVEGRPGGWRPADGGDAKAAGSRRVMCFPASSHRA